MITPTFCHGDWKTGGIVIGVLSLIGSFPVSASGDISVSCKSSFLVKSSNSFGLFKKKRIFFTNIPFLLSVFHSTFSYCIELPLVWHLQGKSIKQLEKNTYVEIKKISYLNFSFLLIALQY